MKRSSTYFQFIKFSVVGTFGFGVDVCVFYLFTQICNLGLARIIAFLVAVIFTFLLNRSFTFLVEKKTGFLPEFIKYFFSMILVGLANLATSLYLLYQIKFFENYQFIPLALGSVAGLLINFSLSKKIFS